MFFSFSWLTFISHANIHRLLHINSSSLVLCSNVHNVDCMHPGILLSNAHRPLLSEGRFYFEVYVGERGKLKAMLFFCKLLSTWQMLARVFVFLSRQVNQREILLQILVDYADLKWDFTTINLTMCIGKYPALKGSDIIAEA